jgi:serine/threonine protein kinase
VYFYSHAIVITLHLQKFYNEKEARDLAVVILKAIKHCHDHKVVHRYITDGGWSCCNAMSNWWCRSVFLVIEGVFRCGLLATTSACYLAYYSVNCPHMTVFTCRDLKPENLLMTGRDDSSADLKLVDFGFAAKVPCIVVASSPLLSGVTEGLLVKTRAGGGILTDEPVRDAGLRRAGDHSQAGPR